MVTCEVPGALFSSLFSLFSRLAFLFFFFQQAGVFLGLVLGKTL